MGVVNVEWPRTGSCNASIGRHGSISSSVNCTPCANPGPVIGYLVAVGPKAKIACALSCVDSSNEGSIRARSGHSNSDRLRGTSGNHPAIRFVKGTAYPDIGTVSGFRSSLHRRRTVRGSS